MTLPFLWRNLALCFLALPILTGCSPAEDDGQYKTGASGSSFDHSHATFTSVLEKHVKNEQVDYAALKKNPGDLNAYLDTLAAVPKQTFNFWNRDQQMAFLINLYNAATLKLVIDHDPVKSIKDIGGILKGPWKQKVVRLFGRYVTLDHVEHGLLRPNYGEPRIHFAVNCASIGCPALRPEAFQASKLDTQLDEQARGFLRDTSKNHLDADKGVLHLSPIFDWFEDDFTGKSGSVAKFVAPYFPKSQQATIAKGGLKIRHTDYDWGLNKR